MYKKLLLIGQLANENGLTVNCSNNRIKLIYLDTQYSTGFMTVDETLDYLNCL